MSKLFQLMTACSLDWLTCSWLTAGVPMLALPAATTPPWGNALTAGGAANTMPAPPASNTAAIRRVTVWALPLLPRPRAASGATTHWLSARFQIKR